MFESIDPVLHRPDELVVDLRHVRPVLDHLQGLGALGHAHRVEESTDLELALVSGLDLTIAVADVRQRYQSELDALGLETDAEVMVFALERHFAQTTGTVPVLDTNQDAYAGYPHHKAYAYPQPVVPEWPSELPAVDPGRPRVGIVDTGIERGHERLGDLVTSDSWIDAPVSGVSPLAGHGTFVAGLVVEHGRGAAIEVRAGLDETVVGSAWQVATAIAGFGHDISILNLSLGCATKKDKPPVLIERALDRLDPGVLVIAAAGNRAQDPHPPAYLWPAAARDVVAVGSLGDLPDGADETTLRGKWLDYLTDGTSVRSTYLHGTVEGVDRPFAGAASWTGTSFAAAALTGRVAATLRPGENPLAALDRAVQDSAGTVVRYWKAADRSGKQE